MASLGIPGVESLTWAAFGVPNLRMLNKDLDSYTTAEPARAAEDIKTALEWRTSEEEASQGLRFITWRDIKVFGQTSKGCMDGQVCF